MGSEHVQLLKALCFYHLEKRSKHRRGEGLSRSSGGDRQPSSPAVGDTVPSLVLPGPPLARGETPAAPRLPMPLPDLVSRPHSEDRSRPRRLGWRRSSSSHPQLLLHPRALHRPTPGLQADLPIMSISHEPARTGLHPRVQCGNGSTLLAHPPLRSPKEGCSFACWCIFSPQVTTPTPSPTSGLQLLPVSQPRFSGVIQLGLFSPPRQLLNPPQAPAPVRPP